jgi:hypothetical protein
MLIIETALLNRLLAHAARLRRLLASDRWLARSSYASTRLLDRRFGALCRKQASPFDTVVIQRVTKSVVAAEVNLRKHRSAVWRSAVPKLGVTCPPFFRCEAPRLLHNEY